jgi:phosphoribosylformimino-5-aminoimidazole carboxamide ribotide isomerase
MLIGPNIEATAELVKNLSIPVIASGGVSSLDDIRNLCKVPNLFGAISGKALYSGSIDLGEAIKITMSNG